MTILGYRLPELVLYFCFYNFAGWCMETAFCSIQDRHFVARGFLHGPICPIYGTGVLMMLLFFRPLADNIVLFYVVSTVAMSAWEYFVGWFLEVTTHTKYWDYSMYRFHLKGRICLWVCLVWGVLSYVCVFWVHPPVARLLGHIPPLVQTILAAVLAAVTLADGVVTIRELALMTKAMDRLQQLGDQLQVQAALGKMELRDRYGELVSAAERHSRRFRRNYVNFTVPKLDKDALQAVSDRARQVLEERQAKKAAKKQKKTAVR